MNHTKKLLLNILLIIIPITVLANNSKKIIINEILAVNSIGLRDADGDYSDWIELHNPGNTTVDLTGWSLTDSKYNPRKWTFSNVSIPAGQYLIVFASGKYLPDLTGELHANFNLSKDGEYLGLIDPEGVISDEYTPTFPVQESDVSYGYYQGQLTFFEIPTPGAENTINKKTQVPVFSRARGFYDTPFIVTLTLPNPDPDTKIYYTTNGTRPTEQSTLYTGPVLINKTSPLSAVAVKDNLYSKVVTNTYFFINDIVNQPNNPEGYPDRWGYLGSDIKYNDYKVGERAPADYAMDPNVCNNPSYKDYIKDAFLSIPSVSIVTNPGYLFSESTDENEGGIYIHTGVTVGSGWERPISLEYLEPSTGKQFQVNCGIRLHGAASRQPEKTGKHSFRTIFRGIYGEPKLNFDLFEKETAVVKFDHLVFRAGYNQSWLHPDSWQRTNSQYANDSFAKRIQRDMGHISTHDKFVHLFINGLYWGLYDISERINDKFMADYFDGTDTNFDIINHDGLAAGDIVAYNRMAELAKNGEYNQLLSENLMYMENFIDYMLINFYIANVDWATNNWYAARNRVNPGKGFYFFSWDAESSLTDVNMNRINGSNGFQGKFRSMLFGSSSGTSTTGGLYNNPEFKLLFADRVNKHFFNGGSLTPEKTAEIYTGVVNEIDLAVILESARWGDYRRNTLSPGSTQWPIYTRNDHWLPRKEKLLKDYFPKRTNIVYKQLEALGLVSEIEPPVFSSYGAKIDNPIALTMSSTGGVIYYTTNGTDPRESGSGYITTFASQYKTPLQISETCTVKARSKNGTVWSALSEATFIRANISGSPTVSDNIRRVYYQNNMLYVTLPNEGNALIHIYSMEGKCTQQIKAFCQSGNNRIELNAMQPGVYIYKIEFEGVNHIGKFVK
jgi:hypothetical protein